MIRKNIQNHNKNIYYYKHSTHKMVKRHTKQDMQIERYKTRHAERYTRLLMNTLCAARTWIKRTVYK
jgi:hypothetical protein